METTVSTTLPCIAIIIGLLLVVRRTGTNCYSVQLDARTAHRKIIIYDTMIR